MTDEETGLRIVVLVLTHADLATFDVISRHSASSFALPAFLKYNPRGPVPRATTGFPSLSLSFLAFLACPTLRSVDRSPAAKTVTMAKWHDVLVQFAEGCSFSSPFKKAGDV